ncbi:MAG: pseudouridine synthase [Proteobacteria bacterium]|nr:pseudouridine synthase [Pseudomonadota bacterium]
MNNPTPETTPKGDRIAKIMARAGLCSRRDAERWIAEGRVAVAGKVIDSPALNITDLNSILVDGKPLPNTEPPRLWRYHKPPGIVTTARDPEGRPTVSDKMPAGMPRVMPIGRLDITSEGLLLLTNDGELKRHLELPTTGWTRRYRARVYGRVEVEKLEALSKGVTVEGIQYGAIEAKLEHQEGANAWVAIGIREGKNREVRKVMAHLGYTVNRLIRISFGPFQLGGLERGVVEEMPTHVLRDQLGKATAEKLGIATRRG